MGSYSVSIDSIHWRDPLFRVKDSGFQLMTHVYSDWTKKNLECFQLYKSQSLEGCGNYGKFTKNHITRFVIFPLNRRPDK